MTYPKEMHDRVLELVHSGATYKGAAREVGIEHHTAKAWVVQEYRRRRLEVHDDPANPFNLDPVDVKASLVGVSAEIATIVSERLSSEAEELPWKEARDAQVAYGIAIDKFLDLTEGRKGSVNIDNRQQTLNISPDSIIRSIAEFQRDDPEGFAEMVRGLPALPESGSESS